MHACLERMRDQAYLIQSRERAEERNKPAWYVPSIYTIHKPGTLNSCTTDYVYRAWIWLSIIIVLSLIILFRFALLEKEIKAMFDAQDKEASMITEKLRQFIHVDIDAIPHVMVSK